MGIKVYPLIFLCGLYQMPDSLLKLHALVTHFNAASATSGKIAVPIVVYINVEK
jgi:hypothetical protein